ncbi:LacI family DNA-binding transcriptional regulator [Lentzea flava]|uniref:LacI family transcriptional regulator n=1 Tax=Lentzea flava TaxID=103732 RepID=A0ABQ2VFB1_9PSEU|nr:LacI family DNA-binding transcriptional regulator [Lentzea flava]MCP2204763.1 transcriptional regulator, LacI family [Lentzea flava]GGU81427.1 LacI family transcriptional regulator [Lentzea flava]
MRVTLKDIAQRAGVSTMTVSNVINGNRARASPETIERIQQIADELGYVPSASARSLAARTSRMVGVFVPAADEESLTISPHNVAIIGQLERELRKRAYDVLLRGIARPGEVATALRSWNLDGALLLGFLDEEVALFTARSAGRTRIVAVDSYADNPVTLGVRADDHAGGRIAAEHLLALGHRDVLFVGPRFSEAGVVWQRFEGFRCAFTAAGLERDDRLVELLNTTYDDGVTLGRRLRADHPSVTAVFATADVLAIGIMEGLRESGVRVPDDVSVVGFDDLDLCVYVRPTLTTIAQDIAAKAATAVHMLVGEIEHEDQPSGPVTLGVHLVQRMSTGPVRT